MINKAARFFLLNVVVVLVIVSCASKPPAGPQGPDQALVDELNAAMARAQSGREKALAVQGQVYFPDEWGKAESDNNAGKNAKRDTDEGVRQGIALFTSAAEGYEAIAGNAGPLFAKDQEEANSALQAAMARADQSRKDAQDNQGPEYFPDEWASAEAEYKNGIDAKKDTMEEMKAAAAIYNSAADSYDDIAGKSQQILAKDNADKELQAAMARAEKSRQDAMSVNGQTYFPNDWRNAEAKNTSGKDAKKTTTDEIKAAAALFVSAADAYDDVARRSQQLLAKEKDDATRALQAAMARMEKSKKDAQDAKANVNLPTDWNNAEAKNRTAGNAKRATVAEIKAAAPLYISAADAYDDLVKKNVAFLNTQNQKSAEDARTRAQQERQKALDVKANIAVANEFSGADAVFQQAAKDFGGKVFTSAAELYNKSADQFIAAALSAEKKRALANETVGEAKQKSDQSADFAVNTGVAMEGKNETI